MILDLQSGKLDKYTIWITLDREIIYMDILSGQDEPNYSVPVPHQQEPPSPQKISYNPDKLFSRHKANISFTATITMVLMAVALPLILSYSQKSQDVRSRASEFTRPYPNSGNARPALGDIAPSPKDSPSPEPTDRPFCVNGKTAEGADCYVVGAPQVKHECNPGNKCGYHNSGWCEYDRVQVGDRLIEEGGKCVDIKETPPPGEKQPSQPTTQPTQAPTTAPTAIPTLTPTRTHVPFPTITVAPTLKPPPVNVIVDQPTNECPNGNADCNGGTCVHGTILSGGVMLPESHCSGGGGGNNAPAAPPSVPLPLNPPPQPVISVAAQAPAQLKGCGKCPSGSSCNQDKGVCEVTVLDTMASGAQGLGNIIGGWIHPSPTPTPVPQPATPRDIPILGGIIGAVWDNWVVPDLKKSQEKNQQYQNCLFRQSLGQVVPGGCTAN